MYHTYILKCADNTLYTGITTNVKRREKEHNSDQKGAKYTRVRRPVKLVYQKAFKTKSAAMCEESRIKRLSRGEKLALIGGF
jgi:putative endonuclease